MPENFEEKLAQMKDIKASEKEKQKPGLDLAKGPELDELANAAGNLASKIEGDKDVFQRDLDRLREALGKMKVDFAGEGVPLEEIRKNAEMRKNVMIWNQIKRGDFNSIGSLTRLTPEITWRLVLQERVPGFKNGIILDNVREITVDEAIMLSETKGDILVLGIESLSPEVAKYLSRIRGRLFLNGVKTIDDETAKYLARQVGTLYLRNVESLSDVAIGHLIKHVGYLEMWRLENVSDVGARLLAKIERWRLKVGPLLQIRIDEINKYKLLWKRFWG